MPPRKVDSELDLLVVSRLTHAFSMSRPRTRTSAAGQTTDVSKGIGLREWLETVRVDAALRVATLIPRIYKPWLSAGKAAKAFPASGLRCGGAGRELLRIANRRPTTGPKVERACRWHEELAEVFVTTKGALAES